MKINYNFLILFLILPTFPYLFGGRLVFIYSLILPLLAFIYFRKYVFNYSPYLLMVLLLNFIWPILGSILSLEDQSNIFIFSSLKELNIILWYFLGIYYSSKFKLNQKFKISNIYNITFTPVLIYFSFSLLGGLFFNNNIKSYYSAHPELPNHSFPEYLHYNLSSTSIFLYLMVATIYLSINNYYVIQNINYLKDKNYRNFQITFDLITILLFIICSLTLSSALPVIIPSIIIMNLLVSNPYKYNFSFWKFFLISSGIYIFFSENLIPFLAKVFSYDLLSAGRLTVIINKLDTINIFNILYSLLLKVLGGSKAQRISEVSVAINNPDILQFFFGTGIDNNNFFNMTESLYSYLLLKFGFLGTFLLLFFFYKFLKTLPIRIALILLISILTTSFSGPAIFAPKSGPVFWFVIGFVSNRYSILKNYKEVRI